MGWILTKKHPAVIRSGQSIPLDDLLSDPIVRFQRIFFIPLVALLCFAVPTMLPAYYWHESLVVAFFVAAIMRLTLVLNVSFMINSLAHMLGSRPYDSHIGATDNASVAMLACGEGFHNFHHTFPWDYATSELGWVFNFSTLFIDVCASVGLAYDLKKASSEMIQARKKRNHELDADGDGDLHHH